MRKLTKSMNMKNLFFIAFILLFFSCKKQEVPNQIEPGKRIAWFEQLEANFNDPPAEYRTAPFWVWNNDVSKEDIDYTLTRYKDKGFGGVFLHPRYGMITEYLSDEWFELVAYSLKKAKELDLKLWIYDENSFPSGFAGGHVPAQMPESNSEGVALKPHYMDVLRIPDEAERPLHIFQKENGEWIEITSKKESEIGKKGEYCVLDLNDYETSKWFGGYSYIDLLKPGVTEKFIEITMPGYEKSIGHEFGNIVPGVFTDEPNTNTRRAGPIRYTPDLYEQFEKQWGYKLEPHLMSLITETGEWKKVRHNYQSTILQLFIDRWAKPWYKYTEEKNLLWTGHYWEHGWPSPKEGPDNMAMYAWHQQPGIDMLFNSEKERPDQFGNIRNVKELSSVANQFDRHRTLSETYGAAGWELTFEDMKRLGDWEFVLGVNYMNQHLAYISMVGDRKHDFPQSFGTHSPYWGVFRYHTDYFARLSLALSSGHQRNNILVIEPTTTAWMYYNPTDQENKRMNEVKKKFEPFLKTLEKYQVEYDLGCENIIKDQGRIENGKFVINKAAYDKVILPPGTENLDKKTFELIKEFVEAGGKVYQVDTEMTFVDGQIQSYDELQSVDSYVVYKGTDKSVLKELAQNPDIEFEDAENINGMVFHHRRELENGQILFLTNFDKTETAEFKVKVKGKSVLNLDAETGKIEPIAFKKRGGKVNFNVKLYPAGSKLLFISREKGEKRKQPVFEKELLETNVSSIKKVEPNVLTLDYVELTMGKFKNEHMYFYAASNEIWQKHGYPDNPWVSSSQFKTELVDADNFGKGTGFKVVYPFY
ncbi:MAG: glycosyl hydrolase, partial [Draconibacterium sp.]|nr:glycosyl hydrolase [Draconibacterium sp.]